MIPVGALPHILTFTPDGRKLLVANEATPDVRLYMLYRLELNRKAERGYDDKDDDDRRGREALTRSRPR